MSERVKIIGNRQPATGFEQAASFWDTVIALRGDRPFIPKGYYRFKTFEEAQAWSIRMMARAGSTLVPYTPEIAIKNKKMQKQEGIYHKDTECDPSP